MLNPLAPNIYDAQGPVRAAIFFAGALLATGAALVFRGFVWNESRMAEDAPERNALRIWALCLTLAGAVALPALVTSRKRRDGWTITEIGTWPVAIVLVAADATPLPRVIRKLEICAAPVTA